MFPSSLTGLLITAAFVNIACYLVLGFPVVYCAGVWAAQPLAPWMATVRIILCVLVVLSFLWDGWISARPFLATWIAFEVIPLIAAAVFGFGHGCGGHPAWSPHIKQRQIIAKVEPKSPDVFAEVIVPLPKRNPWRGMYGE